MAVFEDDAIVYVKGREKQTRNLLLDGKWECIYIEALNAIHEYMESLKHLID